MDRRFQQKKISLFVLKKSINRKIVIWTKVNTKIKGKIFAFDSFLNLVIKKQHNFKNDRFQSNEKNMENLVFLRGEHIVYLKFL